MGPAATADFLMLLAKKDPAECDQEHPRMIVYEYTETPDRTTYLLAGEKTGPEKLKKAEKLGIPLLTEQQYLDMTREK